MADDNSTFLVDVSTKTYPDKFAVVDAADFDSICRFKWTYCAHGYAKRGATKYEREHLNFPRDVYLHRFILGLTTSEVDHIDGNRLNNTRANLRPVTRSSNVQNRKTAINPLGRGVSRNGARFTARIGIDGKSVYLGTFATASEASQAYEKKASEVCPFESANWRN